MGKQQVQGTETTQTGRCLTEGTEFWAVETPTQKGSKFPIGVGRGDQGLENLGWALGL